MSIRDADTMRENPFRPAGYPQRAVVNRGEESWAVEVPGYNPPYHVDAGVLANDCTRVPGGYADPEDHTQLDLQNRRRYSPSLLFDALGRPLNPGGRKGIAGRGRLGKWGANLAADSIVTRLQSVEGPVWEFLSITKAQGRLATPGGMQDSEESGVDTALRELFEEALKDTEAARAVFAGKQAVLKYWGYTPGPRETDHAWIETAVCHWHLEPEEARLVKLEAGDDAHEANWLAVNDENLGLLHPSHADFVRMAAVWGNGLY
jgi:ADP-ribose pyrophosphatase